MKNLLLLLLCIVALTSTTNAQKNLLQKIKNAGGISKQFTKLAPAEQVSFAPRNARTTFGLDPNTDLVLAKTETDKLGLTHYRYYQTYNNIPVENSLFIAHTKAGKLTSMGGTMITDFSPKMNQSANASVSPAQAIQAALSYVHAEKYAWQDADFEQRIKLRQGKLGTYYPVPSKVWYGGDAELDPEKLTLSYKIDVYSLKPLDRKYIYVDAKSGRVLGTKQRLMHSDAVGTAATGYSGTQTIHSDFNGSVYRLRDLTKGDGVITLHASGSHADYTSTSANWSFNNADKWALDAHFGVASTWTFYKNLFNRNSIDDSGFALISWVNDASTPNNAYWDGSEMVFGNLSSNGNGLTAIDITGHELTHGVTEYTSGLVYSKEPGAMNESLSDIMGKSVQFYTKPADSSWILSNDMEWEIRSFSNPNADGQPDTYKGNYWNFGSSDNYGVHTNSGVGNYMFYLLVTGGSGTNDLDSFYNVSGIGLAKADQIIYRTETVYLTSISQYADWRAACINAAADLYGPTSHEVIQVENAWYAVGIGPSGNGSCNLEAPGNVTAGSITNTTAKISWAPVVGATGYILQWKPASAISYNTITGLTGTTYNLSGLTQGTFHDVKISTVCSNGGNGVFSAPVTFKTTGIAPIVYCTSVGKTFDGLTNVMFNTIDNVTSGTTSGYTDYTSTQSTIVSQTSTYSLSAKINTGGNFKNYTKAWIDWNHDGVFNTTTEEYNLGTVTNVTNGVTSFSPVAVAVPAGAAIGKTRMRVSTQYNALPSPCTASFDGEVEDYSVVVVAGGDTSACAIPSGLIAASVSENSATLKWTPVSGATGYNVHYRLSGTTDWTKIYTKSATLVKTGLAEATSYQFTVATLCDSAFKSKYSTLVTFTTTGGVVPYCASSGSTSYEYIKTVALDSINHTVANDGGYGDFTSLSTTLAADSNYTINITPGFSSSAYPENYTVFIDYNADGIFNEIGELVATGSGTGVGPKSLSFTVPATAKKGLTRMRVQLSYGTASTDACATLTFGDVHDYSVNITGGATLKHSEIIAGKPAANIYGFRVFPNPIAGSTATLAYQLPADGRVLLKVVDMMGREIQSVSLGKQKPGAYTYTLNSLKSLIKGNYVLAVYQDNKLVGRDKIIVLSK